MYHLFWAKYRCIKFHTKFETLTKTLTKSPIKARSEVWFSNWFWSRCKMHYIQMQNFTFKSHFPCLYSALFAEYHSFFLMYIFTVYFVFLKVNKFELYRMARAGTRRRKNFVDNCKCGAWLLRREEDSSSCLSRPAEWIFGSLIFHITLVYSAYTEQQSILSIISHKIWLNSLYPSYILCISVLFIRYYICIQTERQRDGIWRSLMDWARRGC